MALIEVAIYEAAPGDRIRVALKYDDSWRPIFWFMLKKDGSIYLGPRYENVTTLKIGTKRAEDGSLTILYEEGQEITEPALLNSKVSFHASGVIHSAGERLFRSSTRSITEQQELCRVLFRHPSTFEPIREVKNRDVCLNYSYDEDHPLQALFFVAPKSHSRLVRVREAENQTNLHFPFIGLDAAPDLVLQFVFFHASKMEWPPYTYLIFGTVAAKQD